jgi:hypothetical protein
VQKHLRLGLSVLVAVLLLAELNAAASSVLAATRTPTPTRARPRDTATPSPTATASQLPPIIADSGYEVLFPVMIRFWITLRLPAAKVKSAQIHIVQTDFIDQTISPPVKDTIKVLNDEASIVYFPWLLNAQNAPQPFAPMRFDWSVVTADGKSYSSKPITLLYSDTFKQWQKLDDDPIHLYTHNPALNLLYVRTNVTQAYKLIAKQTGLSKSYTFVLYDQGSEPCQTDPRRLGQKIVTAGKDGTTYPCDSSNAAVIYGARGYIFLQRTSPLVDQLQDDIIRYVADDALKDYWKTTPPAWFRAGLIQSYTLSGRGYALLLARDSARADRLLTLKALSSTPTLDPKDFGASVRIWNAQSFMLTLYLSARFGAAAPFDLSDRLAQGAAFADALAAVGSGITEEALYNNWTSWLLSPNADTAAGWTPYITVATPTLTPTETGFPTLTPTSSIPTETPTAFPSITPRPTRTPTVIPPSNTPRPPGSLPTSTP